MTGSNGKMSELEPDSAALKALCERTDGGRKAVAAKLHANEQTLYQIIAAIKMKSGLPRVVGRSLRARLDREYPGWRAHVPPAGPSPLLAQETAAIYGPASDDSTLEQLADLIARIPAANRRAVASELAAWVNTGEGSPAAILALLEGAARRRAGNGPR